MYGYVYLTKNMLNGRCYVGSHKKTEFDKRYYGSGNLILRAIRKYGKKNFKCRILYKASNYQNLMDAETYFIKAIKEKYGKLTYNISDDARRNMLGLKHSRETKEKYSRDRSGENNPMYGVSLTGDKNGMYGKTHSDEAKKKISKKLSVYKGELSPNFGLVRNEEFKRKVSLSKKGKKLKGDIFSDISLEYNLFYSDMPKWCNMIVASYRQGAWQKRKTLDKNINRFCDYVGCYKYKEQLINGYSKNINYYKELQV